MYAEIKDGKFVIQGDVDTLIYALAHHPTEPQKVVDKVQFEKDLLDTINNPLDTNQESLGLTAFQYFMDQIFSKMAENGSVSLEEIELK